MPGQQTEHRGYRIKQNAWAAFVLSRSPLKSPTCPSCGKTPWRSVHLQSKKRWWMFAPGSIYCLTCCDELAAEPFFAPWLCGSPHAGSHPQRKSPGRIWRGEFIAGTENARLPCVPQPLLWVGADFKPVSCGDASFCDCLLLSGYSTRGGIPVQ